MNFKSVSDILMDQNIDPALDQLDDEKFHGIGLIAFARTVIDRPENFEKIVGSYSGHAADLQIRCTLKELQLWCCRVWERNGNSLPNLARWISPRVDDIIAARRSGHDDWPEKFLGIEELPEKMEKWSHTIQLHASSDLVARLRERRSEHFAHLLLGKSADRRFRERLKVEEGYTLNEVLGLAEVSIELLDEAFNIWRFHVHASDRTLRMLSRYFESYWAILPIFRDHE